MFASILRSERWSRCLLLPLVLSGCLGGTLHAAQLVPDFELEMDARPIDREDSRFLTSYAPVLRTAREAVVSVHTVRIIKTYRSRGIDPREEMLRRFFGLPVPPSRSGEAEIEERRDPVGIGSGVVITDDGYILTNNHVILAPGGRQADDVLVQLNDGRELEAEVVGRDPQSDLAVLKVDAEGLPFLPIADSRNLEVGDIAFAIGNPMGVGLTITQGIISATGRNNLSILGESGYENFIQTDAPINPGNSGGALVDAYGRLIGINTAILSRSGGSIGIGFAIPSSFARSVATGIIREGEVRRGLLGVNMESLNPDYVAAFGLESSRGVLVQSVIPGLPAERAGLRNGDVIVALDGEGIEDAADLRLRVAGHPPGRTVRIDYLRDGAKEVVEVVLGDARDPYGYGANRGELLPGIDAVVIDRESRREFGLPEAMQGLIVRSVRPGSPYAELFGEGAIIVQINGETPRSIDEAIELIESKPVSYLYVYYEGRSGYLPLRPIR